MQQLHDVRPKEDIKAANRPFAQKNRDDEFSKIDTQDATHVADQVRRNQRKQAPGEYDEHGIALKDVLQLFHPHFVFPFELIIEMQRFGKIVDTRG